MTKHFQGFLLFMNLLFFSVGLALSEPSMIILNGIFAIVLTLSLLSMPEGEL